ncbi:nucleoside phosphorylase domain-containing protein [Aspergillus nidulans var. acristatus]
MLDKIHAPPHRSLIRTPMNLANLNDHYILIAYLSNGVYGTVSAATVVSRMRLTLSRLQLRVMVGISGGVSLKSSDIRLGDVVVSKPGRKHGGVIHYDYGKAVQGGQFEPTGILNQPPQSLLTHMSQLQAKQMRRRVLSPPPGARDTDYLFEPSYHHADNDSDCEKCDKKYLVERQPRLMETIYVHYALIASGDQVMKNLVTRDHLAQEQGVLCFEMEAAGLMNELPTLVIRGIYDYCDSRKQKQWQGYAALTAAAYRKLLLAVIPPCKLNSDLLESSKIRHCMVSLPRNPKFVGRDDEIKKLEELLSMQDGPRRIAFTGFARGEGRHALELVYRRRDQDSGCSIFWVPCTSHAMIEQSFLEIAQIPRLCGVKPAEIKEQIQAYLSSKNAGKWLLVLICG